MTIRDFLIWLLLVPQVGFQRRWQLVELLAAADYPAQLVPDETVLSILPTPTTKNAFKAWYAQKDWLPAWQALQHYPCLTLLDPAYPSLLKALSQPPLVLFYQGNLDLLKQPSIAIVGSRQMTAESEQVLKEWLPEFIAAGLTIVSGNARGVDACAHRVTLGRRGCTIAVLGTGIDQTYPKNHGQLQRAIAQQGLVLSEFLPWVGPQAWHFPLRNRIIVGLSLQLLIVQAGLRSGSLVSAAIALDENRDVWAIPGPIYQPSYAGSNQLLAAGAAVALQPQDLINDRPDAWNAD